MKVQSAGHSSSSARHVGKVHDVVLLLCVLFVLPTADGQGVTQQDGPYGVCFYPVCVEEECCGLGTTWVPLAEKCLVGFPSFDGTYSDDFEEGCAKHSCFDARCCGPDTVFSGTQCTSEDVPPFVSHSPSFNVPSQPAIGPSSPIPVPVQELQSEIPSLSSMPSVTNEPSETPSVSDMPSESNEPSNEPSACPPEPPGAVEKKALIEKRDPDVIPGPTSWNFEIWDPANNKVLARIVERWMVFIRATGPNAPIEIKVMGMPAQNSVPAMNNQNVPIAPSVSSQGDMFRGIAKDNIYQTINAMQASDRAGNTRIPDTKRYTISGCVVLHDPGNPRGGPSASPPLNLNVNPQPVAFRRIDANGRWITVEYVITKEPGKAPTIDVKTKQQKRTAVANRKCTPPPVP